MKKDKIMSVIKWMIYYLLLIILFSFQTTPNLFEIMTIKPVLILSLCVSVAMYEDVMVSSIYGLITGFLWDISSDKLFGFNAIILIVSCMLISLLCIYYLRTKWLNAVMFVSIVSVLQGLIDYVFYYGIWRYDYSGSVLLKQLFPTVLYTIAVTPIIFFLVTLVARNLNHNIRA